MLSFGPFKVFLLISYIGNNENPPITDEICWSLDIRYCGAQLYFGHPYVCKWPKSIDQEEVKNAKKGGEKGEEKIVVGETMTKNLNGTKILAISERNKLDSEKVVGSKDVSATRVLVKDNYSWKLWKKKRRDGKEKDGNGKRKTVNETRAIQG